MIKKLRNIFAVLSGVSAVSGTLISGYILSQELVGQMSDEPWGMCAIYISDAPKNCLYGFLAAASACAILAIIFHIIHKREEKKNQENK